jgi:hypothetical protein
MYYYFVYPEVVDSRSALGELCEAIQSKRFQCVSEMGLPEFRAICEPERYCEADLLDVYSGPANPVKDE